MPRPDTTEYRSKRPNYQFTTLEEIVPELEKAKVFSTVDRKKGFLQMTEKETVMQKFN